MKLAAVIVAAGRGERAGLGMNKVFYPLDGIPVLARTLEVFLSMPEISGIAVVLNPADRDAFDAMRAEYAFDGRVLTAEGGATRGASVYNGLCALSGETDVVMVHDAARPFVTPEMIRATVEDAVRYGSGVLATPVTDTIKLTDDAGDAVETLPRDRLAAVQTPQTFPYAKLLAAYEKAAADGYTATDDAALMEKYEGKVHLTRFPGAEVNRKLTTKRDFMPEMPQMRIGTGYDVHKLVEDRKLILLGEEIPHEKGLLGHSDADVACHALMDAMLGACALGDIGLHFPDSDPKYAGISSMKLLDEVIRLTREAGYRLSNCDITIVAQRPKLRGRIDAMRENLAARFGVGIDRIGVKATTTERLGFEGEEKGISAQAVVMMEKI